MKVWDNLKKSLNQDKRKVKKLVEGRNFDMMIMSLILFDAVIMGLMTTTLFGAYDWILFILDRLCMAIFIAEMLMKVWAYGKKFFKNGWNLFDFIIVAISSLPTVSFFIVLRTFRLFLVLRYINRFKRLRQVIVIFIELIPSFLAMLLIFAVFFYVFAIMAVSLFGDTYVEFSTLGASSFTLLQLFTLDGWAVDIARPVMREFPYAWIFFVSFIFISFLMVISFIMSAVTEIFRKMMGLLPKCKI